MKRDRTDLVVAVAGVTAIVVGALLLVDQAGDGGIGAGWLAAIAAAAAGVVLVASGIWDREG